MNEQQLARRVRHLEQFRDRAGGELNALNTLVLSALTNLVMREPDPVAEVRRWRDEWLREAPQPHIDVRGIDPNVVQAATQDYIVSLERLTSALVAHVEAMSGRQGK